MRISNNSKIHQNYYYGLLCQTFYSFARSEMRSKTVTMATFTDDMEKTLYLDRQTYVRRKGLPLVFFYGVWMELPGLRNLISVFMTYNEITAVLLDCYCLLILLGFLSVFNLMNIPIFGKVLFVHLCYWIDFVLFFVLKMFNLIFDYYSKKSIDIAKLETGAKKWHFSNFSKRVAKMPYLIKLMMLTCITLHDFKWF